MTNLLHTINCPSDLNKLGFEELNVLAQEMRDKIIETVSNNGGHLAPNLGAVELAIALHYVFDSPKDKIIWDVGHQAYPHKLLTGRCKDFHTIRQYKGLSGYCRRDESDHDVFGAGHASTSISAALGFAEARDLKGEKYDVIAVIGDGSLTGGMSFEALNQAGHLNSKMIVVLNDNFMSISPNVGAMSAYTNRLSKKLPNWPLYNQVRKEIYYLLDKLEGDEDAINSVRNLRESALHVLTAGLIFEELGFDYMGPVDGHNIKALSEALVSARKADGPVLLHVITKKGKGYDIAENNSEKFHGVSPFEPISGMPKKKSNGADWSTVFSTSVTQAADKDEKIVAVTAAMPSGTKLSIFAQKHPDRFYDVGIAEQHAITFSAGMAANGLKPVAAIYSTFLQRAFDQVQHDVCLQNLPVVIGIDRAGVVGDDGPTHHGVFDITFLRPIPCLTLMSPKDEPELQSMVKTAFALNKPVAIRYPRGSGSGKPLLENWDEVPLIEEGKAEVLRDGRDVTLVGLGPFVETALQAAELLEKQGISAAVINARFVKPLDKQLLVDYAKKTKAVVTIEDGVIAGGFGSAVLELLDREGLSEVKNCCLGWPDEFIEHGKPSELVDAYNLNAEGVAAAAKKLVGK
ncbi:MAG: 1-deoxy-D-xylulose-5-phosphate synthase [Candidatus Micrarchaeota archaeon]